MDFLKKHYDKILLGVVLLGLAVMVAFLFSWIASEQQKLDERTHTIIGKKANELPPIKSDELLEGLNAVRAPDFSMTNRLFNPVKWQKAADGKLIKIVRGDEIGPGALMVTNITPLYLTVTLKAVMTNDTVPRYNIGIENEAAPTLALRRERPYYASVGTKTPAFTLTESKGSTDEPELTLVLADTGERAPVSKAKPFRRVDAYTAELKYDPEKLVFHKVRVGGTPIVFGGEKYNIVAISETEVVISAESNNKKTTITFNGAP